MALPIAPTPFLTGKDAERFDRLVAEGLKHPLKPREIQVDWEALRRIKREIQARRQREGVK